MQKLMRLEEVIGQRVIGQEEGVRAVCDAVLRHHFRPEFLNRIDDIVVFHPLTPADIRRIVDVQMARVAKRLAERELTLELTPEAGDLLAEQGYDPVYGARPLKRAIQRSLLDPLAREILTGTIQNGATVRVERNGDALRFQTQNGSGD
jgi:ATP-dependent Clp protease ATP-binding subunit ClpB